MTEGLDPQLFGNVQKPASKKKWWLIGCGGCLGVVVLIVIAVVILGAVGFNAFKENNKKLTGDLFGSEKALSDYTVLAFPFPMPSADSFEMQNIAVLTPRQKNRFPIFAWKGQVAEVDISDVRSHQTARIKAYAQRMSEAFLKLVKSGRTSSRANRVEGIQFQSTNLVPLKNGKRVSFARLNITIVTRKGERVQAPASLALLPQTGSSMIILLAYAQGVDPATQPATFALLKNQYAPMEQQLSALIDNSTLDDRSLL
jgi:hypothetical protein